MVGFTGGLPSHVGVELSEGPCQENEEAAEGDPEPPHDEKHEEEHVSETETKGLHADATLLVVGGGHGAATGGYHVEQCGELGFRSSGNEVGEWHICYFIYY